MSIDLKKSSISLKKGESISLRKPEIVGNDIVFSGAAFSGMLRVGLGWDPVTNSSGNGGFLSKLFGGTGETVDCDSFAILFNRVDKSEECVYFGHMKNSNGSVRLLGDNLTGEGEGDDETILLNLAQVAQSKILIGMNIYNAVKKHQSLGSLRNAYIRLVDDATGIELASYTITPDDGRALGLKFVELLRDTSGCWSCKTLGEKVYQTSIAEIVNSYR